MGESMIQNTLAVNFVLQVDRILYQAFTSEHTKASLSQMDPVIREVSNRVRFMTWALNTVVYPLIVLTGTCVAVLFSKYQECDSYRSPIALSEITNMQHQVTGAANHMLNMLPVHV